MPHAVIDSLSVSDITVLSILVVGLLMIPFLVGYYLGFYNGFRKQKKIRKSLK